jgi:hypothetical protein
VHILFGPLGVNFDARHKAQNQIAHSHFGQLLQIVSRGRGSIFALKFHQIGKKAISKDLKNIPSWRRNIWNG